MRSTVSAIILIGTILIGCTILLTGCTSFPKKPNTQKEITSLQVKVMPQNSEMSIELSLNAYSAVHSVYSGLMIPLRLVEAMDLSAKYRLLYAMWASSSQEGPSVRIVIPHYFEQDQLCVLPHFRRTQTHRLEWISNAIYSPIIKGPLRGEGRFVSSEAEPMQNIKDTIFICEDRAVRLSELYSHERQRYLKEQGADLHLVQLYLHDGRSSNDKLIPPLLDKQQAFSDQNIRSDFALGLMQVQYCLYTNDYEKAGSILEQLTHEFSEVSPLLQKLYRFTYEEYCLTQAFNFQDTTYLVEYKEFLHKN